MRLASTIKAFSRGSGVILMGPVAMAPLLAASRAALLILRGRNFGFGQSAGEDLVERVRHGLGLGEFEVKNRHRCIGRIVGGRRQQALELVEGLKIGGRNRQAIGPGDHDDRRGRLVFRGGLRRGQV